MWKRIRKQLLKIPRLGDWIVSSEDSRAHQKLRDQFVPLIEKARREKRELDAQNLYSEWNFEKNNIDEPTYVTASDKLVRSARRHYVAIPATPDTYDKPNDDWWLSNATGDWALSGATYERLQREVLAAQRAANDEWRKWATLLLAMGGFVLGLTSIWVKTKQPDPCQRNYYRNDAGACVFALPLPPSPTVQAPPAPASAPMQPNPSVTTKKKRSAVSSSPSNPVKTEHRSQN
jgi:hypothetical protein